MASLKDKLNRAARGETTLGFDPLANDQARLVTIRLEDIEPDPEQPRKDPGDLEGLAASIKQHGIMQPMIVSPVDDHRYRIIAGERRYSAARLAGLRTVPVLVRTVQDHNRLQLQLVENLHRKDLDPFEEADGYQRLTQDFNLTHENMAEQIGKSRTHITQTLSLSRIPAEVRVLCQSSDIKLSRDTLYLIAKQDDQARMLDMLQAVRDGLPHEARRERARKGEPRTDSSAPAKKPKQVYSTSQDATVIIQSLTDTLTVEQSIAALREALAKALDDQGREPG